MKQMQFTFAILATLLFSSLISSCNKDRASGDAAGVRSIQDESQIPTTPGVTGEAMDLFRTGCPMTLQDAAVAVSNTEGGIALTFTADSDAVSDLRNRVRRMSRMYEMHMGRAGMMWNHMDGKGMGHNGGGMGGEGLDHMNRRDPMPAVSTTVTDMDWGARIELRPSDALKLEALREHIRWHQRRMHYGECWMLQEQSTVTLRGEQK